MWNKKPFLKKKVFWKKNIFSKKNIFLNVLMVLEFYCSVCWRCLFILLQGAQKVSAQLFSSSSKKPHSKLGFLCSAASFQKFSTPYIVWKKNLVSEMAYIFLKKVRLTTNSKKINIFMFFFEFPASFLLLPQLLGRIFIFFSGNLSRQEDRLSRSYLWNFPSSFADHSVQGVSKTFLLLLKCEADFGTPCSLQSSKMSFVFTLQR